MAALKRLDRPWLGVALQLRPGDGGTRPVPEGTHGLCCHSALSSAVSHTILILILSYRIVEIPYTKRSTLGVRKNGLSHAQGGHLAAAGPAMGPRHLCFHPNGSRHRTLFSLRVSLSLCVCLSLSLSPCLFMSPSLSRYLARSVKGNAHRFRASFPRGGRY